MVEIVRLVRPAPLCKRLGVSRATLHRWVTSGEFPRPVKIGRRAVAWSEEAISAWLAAREAA